MSNILEEIKRNIWSFGSVPNNTFGFMVFRDDHRICGYRHINECFWELDDECLVLKNADGAATSVFLNKDFDENYWIGAVVSSKENIQHFLSINTTRPVNVPFTDRILQAAQEGGFYFSHFKKRENVYENGENIKIYPLAFIEPGAILPKGSIFQIGAFSYFDGLADFNLSVGRYCSIASGLKIFGNSHPINWLTSSPVAYTTHHHDLFFENKISTPPPKGHFLESHDHVVTKIGNDVWIGSDCLIKPGINIADGAIIAARSIVTKDVPPYAIVGGAPARTLKFRFDEKTIERLLQTKWWELDIGQIPIVWSDINTALTEIEKFISRSNGKLQYQKKDWALEIIKTMDK